MNCLCCGKALPKDAGTEGWHPACIKNFFGIKTLPDIDVSEAVLKQLAVESTSKGYTVPGVQKKLSLHLTEGTDPRLTLVNYPTGYILKPQTEEYKALPEMEYLVMRMAAASGIKTVPFALVQMPSQNNAFAYITKRIDRIPNQMLAMEDFCQLDGRLTEDKYRGSYERCAKIVSKYSVQAGLDLSELYLRIVFSFAIGNSDMHLKNFSLIESAPGSQKYALSSAYDMLSTNVVIPSDPEELALTINGEKRNIRRKDFFVFAETAGVSAKSAEKMIGKIVAMQDSYIAMCKDSYIPDDQKEALIELVMRRINILR